MVMLLLISFAVGFLVGAHHAYLLRKVDSVYTTLQDMGAEKQKASGVVRPRIAGAPVPVDMPSDERKSSVVRPRMPQTGDEDKQTTLNTVRQRVQ